MGKLLKYVTLKNTKSLSKNINIKFNHIRGAICGIDSSECKHYNKFKRFIP